MPYVPSDGARLYDEAAGAGTPIVFVHEFSGDLWSWEKQIQHFSRRHRCVEFNARFYPPSEVPTAARHYSHDKAVDDVAAVMRHLKLRRAHIVGGADGLAHDARSRPALSADGALPHHDRQRQRPIWASTSRRRPRMLSGCRQMPLPVSDVADATTDGGRAALLGDGSKTLSPNKPKRIGRRCQTRYRAGQPRDEPMPSRKSSLTPAEDAPADAIRHRERLRRRIDVGLAELERGDYEEVEDADLDAWLDRVGDPARS